MFLEIELTDDEVLKLEKGGFLTMSFPGKLRVTVTIDDAYLIESEEEDHK